MTPESLWRAVVRMQRGCGLVDVQGTHRASLHGLRHTNVSLAHERGVPLVVISQSVGHSNVRTTQQIYTHLTDDRHLDMVAEVFERDAAGGPMDVL